MLFRSPGTTPGSSGVPDLNVPCNAYTLLTAKCVFGNNVTMGQVFGNNPAGLGNWHQQSNATQRDCVCGSQLFNQLQGCMACEKAHGINEFDGNSGYLPAPYISSISSAYCAASSTPTEGFADFIYQWAAQTNSPQLSSIESAGSAQEKTSTFSDPIGNKTAVSLYFTPSVMGSQAVAQLTSSPITGTAGVHTVSGQIVATGGASGSASGSGMSTGTASGSATGTSSGSASAAATSKSGVGKKECAAAGAVVGLAALVIFL